MKTEKAVSEIVGALILVALVIGGIAMVSVMMLSTPPPEAMNKAVLSASCQRCGDNTYAIVIRHEGGEPIDPSTIMYNIQTDLGKTFTDVRPDVYFDSARMSTLDIMDVVCTPVPEEEVAGIGEEESVKVVAPEVIFTDYESINSWPVGDVVRIWYDMKKYPFCEGETCYLQKPKNVQIWTVDKRYETSLKVPEFKVVTDEDNPLFTDSLPRPPVYIPPVEESGGTGGSGEPSAPPSSSALIPVYVSGSVCKCGDDKKGGGYCVAQFNYENRAGAEYKIKIREGGLPWNEFTGSGMVGQNRCQPEIFVANPGDHTKFWTQQFWNNIKWKLSHEQSVLVKCDKKTPQCPGDQAASNHPCNDCTIP